MKKILIYFILLLVLPAIAFLGYWLYEDKQYEIISLFMAFLACLPFFIRFEERRPEARELVLVATFIALSVVSRIVFSVVPGFKPVAAFTIIVAIVYGKEMGFMVGALTAILSNMYFGHGPWTPFQMLAWGIIGFGAGFIFKSKNMRKTWLIIVYGIVSGIFFSLLLDVWTALSVDDAFIISRYFLFVGASFPMMLMYIVSNILFLLILEKPLIRKLERIQRKYGLYE
ncbi:MAG: ECF transporter S component [Bacilli bacterium]|nr:ECF transporter S component [Bacilli bacterium]